MWYMLQGQVILVGILAAPLSPVLAIVMAPRMSEGWHDEKSRP
jgi:hypothetical protein